MEFLKQKQKIRNLFQKLGSASTLEQLALEIFSFQYTYNSLYSSYCDLMGKTPKFVQTLNQIPYLPIQFFKHHTIKTGDWQEERVFKSSGTGTGGRSNHYIQSISFYLNNAKRCFSEFYSDPASFCFLAYLPGYQGRGDSSLITMIDHFINLSRYNASAYYLGKEDELNEVLNHNRVNNIPTVLFGVSFALLSLCEFEINFPNLIVIETGGMKSSELDMTKEEILYKFSNSWNIKHIHSEYGMTELLSQAYSLGEGLYKTPKSMKVNIHALDDPLKIENNNKVGVIHVMDLANYMTCSFIATEDLGIRRSNEIFSVVGRMSNAEIRGCNLLLEDYKS